MNDPDLEMRFVASAGAMLQLVVTGVALLTWIGLERLGAVVLDRGALAGIRLRRDGWLRLIAQILMIVPAAAISGG
ncbi:ABC transporter permease, partial [Rhizobiaceae sp. 2RAB30]